MTLCSKWAKMEPCRRSMTNYGPQALQLSSKFRFLRGSTVAFPSNQQQMEYLHFRFVVTCSRKGGKGSGRSKKKAFRGKVVDRVVLPDSRETAIAQASKALTMAIQRALGTGKGVDSKSATFRNRLVVDVPVLQDGMNELIELADDLVDGLPEGYRSSIAYVLCDSVHAGINCVVSDAIIERHRRDNALHSLGSVIQSLDENQGGKSLPKVLLFIKPTISDMEALERIVGRWKEDRIYILLNAEWSTGSGLANILNAHGEFAETFDSAYSFLPILIKAMMVQQLEGAVYRNASVDDGSGKPWKIFIMRNGGSEQIAQMSRRPSGEEVEASLYNALAVSPPKIPSLIKNIFGRN